MSVPDVREKHLRHDISRALRSPAVAGMFLIIHQVVSVIERDLLAGLDVAQGRDPNAALLANRLAVGRATVIEKTRRIPCYISVQVEFLVETENEPVLRLAAAQGFRLGDAFPGVFNDARPAG